MKIGIIGGSSQVACSVSYYLKKYVDIEVVCFIRSSYSKIFFDLLNITVDFIDLNNKEDIKEKLANCNAIIDFTYPTGELFSISKSIEEIIEKIISSLPENQVYIYMSSIMAYGMPSSEKYIKNYFIPRSSYSYIKRKAEKKCLQMGNKYKIKAYNFRLGQTHGFLQSINTSFREKLLQNDIAFINGHDHELTNTVFINSIAEAIIKFCKGQEKPGTYTLISHPQWTLKQLYSYYLEFYKIPTVLKFIPKKTTKKRGSFNVLKILKRYRSLLETYVLMKMPSLSLKIKGKYRINEIKLLTDTNPQNFEYIDFNLLGTPNGQLIDEINSTYKTVFKLEKEMEDHYTRMIDLKRV